MSNREELQNRLIDKLLELFQLDQPDLDFGFYRIMSVKADQIKSFIEKDILAIVESSLGQANQERIAELTEEYENAIKTAKLYGVTAIENSEPVKKARAELDAVMEDSNVESDVYEHLYRFFDRYYDEGDFVSRRYYTRENLKKSAPYAIPFSGEEIKLHWTNSDQFYTKSSEHYSNFRFDILQAKEILDLSEEEKILYKIPENPLKIHFCIVDSSEGEHGTLKVSEENKRYFVLHEECPLEFNEDLELVINFEYKPLPDNKNSLSTDREALLQEKYGKKLKKYDLPNLEITERVIEALEQLSTSEQNSNASSNDNNSAIPTKVTRDYLNAIQFPSPTNCNDNRILLTKYVNQFTTRNNCDYFIHKDLGGFLKRELDFYIKNEIMHLDDIDSADVPDVRDYLQKIKVIRTIATKLIEFLAQLEDFQIKLWLKKKFVTETNYLITLDLVPDKFLEEIADNEEQRTEWSRLFSIDEIGDLNAESSDQEGASYSEPMTVEFLRSNRSLVLDTAFFNIKFTADLIESIEDFDDRCDGLIVHSENFQALNFLQTRYKQEVDCLYIDPPYNTGDSKILYKNSFDSSAWLTLMENRIRMSLPLLSDDFVYYVAIDDYEMAPLCEMIDTHFPFRREMIIVNHHPQGGKSITLSNTHEYMLTMVGLDSNRTLLGRTFKEGVEERSFRRAGTAESNQRNFRPNSFYAILVNPDTLEIVGIEPPPERDDANYPIENTSEGHKRIYPIGENDSERVWRNSYETGLNLAEAGKLKCSPNLTIYKLIDFSERKPALFSNWCGPRYNAGTHGANLLSDILGPNSFNYPKSVYTVEDAIFTHSDMENGTVLDFFAGSGTTGHAVINLNREDNSGRKYVLVEMGQHFDEVLKPRIAKVVYSKDWKKGKPENRNSGISHLLKYIRLESYEDTLNNIEFDEDPIRQNAVESNKSLKEDYLLHYLLDFDTRGSLSLLNIEELSDPNAYSLKVKKPNSAEQVKMNIDLIETFNFLIGLRIIQHFAPQTFNAKFVRNLDPELPKDEVGKLLVDGNILPDFNGKWWFRKTEGWIPADPMNPSNGQRRKVLIIWRNLSGNLEEDNLILDEWFLNQFELKKGFEFDTVYVNGSNNLANLKNKNENWNVVLIDEEFKKKMWDVKGEVQ